MDEPRPAPILSDRLPKGFNAEVFASREAALEMRFVVVGLDGEMMHVPGTMLSRANKSFLGHTSDLFPMEWEWEDRWTADDPYFRRIPSPRQLYSLYKSEERYILIQEIERLSAIENPGRCMSRRRWYDGWCHRRPKAGGFKRCSAHCSRADRDRSYEIQAELAAQRVREAMKRKGLI